MVYTYDEDKLEKLDHWSHKERELTQFGFRTDWNFNLSNNYYMRQLLFITAKNNKYNHKYLYKIRISVKIGDDLICAGVSLQDGDIICILKLCAYENSIQISLNGKELKTYVVKSIETLNSPTAP